MLDYKAAKQETSRIQFSEELRKTPKLNPFKLMLLVGFANAMASLDVQMLYIANPTIQTEKNFVPPGESIPSSTYEWVNNLYQLACASFAVSAGAVGDRLGQTVAHRWGMATFVVFSVACGLCKFVSYRFCKYGGFYFLLAFRFLQGISGAFNEACSMALSSILVRDEDVAKSMTYSTLMYAVTTSCGPFLGGIIV